MYEEEGSDVASPTSSSALALIAICSFEARDART